ncbi:hypothetical protein CGCSCA1_v000167 [Colletotrichum siamense]|nr:hypothetical protein CGCSCA1_v000167 [Colletotrichum siamense]
MRTQIQTLLFQLHTIDALAILCLATQEQRHTWASNVTVSGLLLWIFISFILLLEFKEYLVDRAPWSIIAMVGPIAIWAVIVSTESVDVYYAGLLAPVWIAMGLNTLAIYDGKNRTNVRRQAWKDKMDLENGARHATGSDSTSSRCGPFRAAQTISPTSVHAC